MGRCHSEPRLVVSNFVYHPNCPVSISFRTFHCFQDDLVSKKGALAGGGMCYAALTVVCALELAVLAQLSFALSLGDRPTTSWTRLTQILSTLASQAFGTLRTGFQKVAFVVFRGYIIWPTVCNTLLGSTSPAKNM